jgi:isocitrate dehydrogenase
MAFTDTVISNIGREWNRGATVRRRKPITLPQVPLSAIDGGRPAVKTGVLDGIDVFIEAVEKTEVLGPQMAALVEGTPFELRVMENRGTKVWPDETHATPTVDFFRLRYYVKSGAAASEDDILDLLRRVGEKRLWVHVERLRSFDGEPGYSKTQGED